MVDVVRNDEQKVLAVSCCRGTQLERKGAIWVGTPSSVCSYAHPVRVFHKLKARTMKFRVVPMSEMTDEMNLMMTDSSEQVLGHVLREVDFVCLNF